MISTLFILDFGRLIRVGVDGGLTGLICALKFDEMRGALEGRVRQAHCWAEDLFGVLEVQHTLYWHLVRLSIHSLKLLYPLARCSF